MKLFSISLNVAFRYTSLISGLMYHSVSSAHNVTKENILKAAFELTSKFGLESLSIGELAKSVGMSKSGLFSHFKSKEKLQIMVMDYAAENFVLTVVKPAIKKKRGIKRIEAMMDNWIKWSGSYLPGGCPFLSAIVEFDDRPGVLRDHIQKLQGTMVSTFERSVPKESKRLSFSCFLAP